MLKDDLEIFKRKETNLIWKNSKRCSLAMDLIIKWHFKAGSSKKVRQQSIRKFQLDGLSWKLSLRGQKEAQEEEGIFCHYKILKLIDGFQILTLDEFKSFWVKS